MQTATQTAIDRIRDIKPHELTTRETCTDALNGYGRSQVIGVTLEVVDSVCLHCGQWHGDLSVADEVAGDHRHKWKERLRPVATGYGKTHREAREVAEMAAQDFLRRNPGFLG